MKYSEFDRCGIHSRLQEVINKSGGYNVKAASELLMKEYQLNNSEIAYEMAKNIRIREEITAIGIDAVVELTKTSLLIEKAKFRNIMYMTEKY